MSTNSTERNEANKSNFEAQQTSIIRLLIQPSAQEVILTEIITDYILWHRVANAVHLMINAHQKEEQVFEPELMYSGYIIAFRIMGIESNGELCEQLGDILFEEIKHDDVDAKESAVHIYKRWMEALTVYSLSNLKDAV